MEKSLCVVAAVVAHNAHLYNCTLHLSGGQKGIYNVVYNILFSTCLVKLAARDVG